MRACEIMKLLYLLFYWIQLIPEVALSFKNG